MKRWPACNTVENPFIKRQNKAWALSDPASLRRPISPPPPTQRPRPEEYRSPSTRTAAVESGEEKVEDHVSFFSQKLLVAARPSIAHYPRISQEQWLALFLQNQHPKGHHFVVHQHDHPVAGTHYDLRLQCNERRSISFTIMYGLPGDPNSRRLNRNATETRVHNLWNHLIETASLETGTMLIWDTGEYRVLPYRESTSPAATDDEDEVPVAEAAFAGLSEPEKLHQAFQERKIRLRLEGTRLPPNYTLLLRLTEDNYRIKQPKKPSRKRKRKTYSMKRRQTPEASHSESESETDITNVSNNVLLDPARSLKACRDLSSLSREESPPTCSNSEVETESSLHGRASDPECLTETVRMNNAYPGATNTISSVHQRKWYLSLDRHGCGFVPAGKSKALGTKVWVRERQRDGRLSGFEKFYVLGRDVERSVVTGRLARDVLQDEGVEGYVPRKFWRAVTE